jgi:hypothetical protein
VAAKNPGGVEDERPWKVLEGAQLHLLLAQTIRLGITRRP